MEQFIGKSDIPMGLGMALAQNIEAMNYFSSLPEAEQRSIIDRTTNIRSKKEMQAFVDNKFQIS